MECCVIKYLKKRNNYLGMREDSLNRTHIEIGELESLCDYYIDYKKVIDLALAVPTSLEKAK